jgi:hypothetical protein
MVPVMSSSSQQPTKLPEAGETDIDAEHPASLRTKWRPVLTAYNDRAVAQLDCCRTCSTNRPEEDLGSSWARR